MSPLKTSVLLAPCAAVLLLAGCSGEESGPKGLLETYTPAYTEARGTVHAEDYFPLVAGDVNGIAGTLQGTLTMSVRGVSGGENVAVDTTEPILGSMGGTVTTLAPRSMAFSQGTFMVFPQVTETFSGSVLQEPDISTSYFEKAQDGIYLRGADADDGTVAEASQPLFLKLPLRVGDSWESATTDAPDLSSEGLVSDFTVRARTYVIGKENIVVAGRTVQALRLEQVAEMDGTASDPASTISMTLAGEFKLVLHLEEGNGLVHQTMSSKMSVKGSGSNGANRVTLKLDANMMAEMERVDGPIAARVDSRAKAAAPSAAPAAAPASAAGSEARARAAAFTTAKAVWRSLGAAIP